MSIRRTALPHVDHFTITPNAWARDTRLSRRARGLLTELLSHRPGWEITTESLIEGGPEGRDAIRGALAELEAAGYLTREQRRDESGKLGVVDHVITDPNEQTPRSEPAPENPSPVLPSTANHPHKKTIPLEDQKDPSSAAAEAMFEKFWEQYPRKVGKIAAEKAWRKAVKSTDPAVIILAVQRYPWSPDRQFIPHPATWLGQGRWLDQAPTPIRERAIPSWEITG